jgi:hypothetical protein
MKASDFTQGQKFRVLSPGSDPKEIRTVESVHSDFLIYSSNLKRFQDVKGICTDTALGAIAVELLPDALTHYSAMLEESRRAA